MTRFFLYTMAVALIAAGIYFYRVSPERLDAARVGSVASAQGLSAGVRRSGDIFVVGTVVPARHAMLDVHSLGLVSDIMVQEGDVVRKGQLLLRQESEEAEAAVAEAEAVTRAAQAELDKLLAGPRPQEIASAESTVEIAQANVTKLTDGTPELTVTALDQTVAKTIAEAELRRAQAALELLQQGARPEEIAAAEAKLAGSEADLQHKRIALADTELYAPFAGTVASLDVQVGQYAGLSAPVLQLADFTAWQVESYNLDEMDVVYVAPGDPARISFDAIPDLLLTGTLERIRPVGNDNEGAHTYTVVVKLDQQDPRIRWNMTAQVVFDAQE